jgi:3-isopropylmalate/(R)-2-methylmalate dehydratase small subunit
MTSKAEGTASAARSAALVLNGKAFRLGDDVNTDIHCSNKYLPGKDPAYVAAHAFEQLSASLATDMAIAGGGILVAGAHFGINSSREQAVHVMKLMNVRAIVAKSFGRQFFRNAINNGMPVFECDTSTIAPDQVLEIDFSAGQLVQENGPSIVTAQILPKEILAIVQCGGLIPFLQKYPDWKFA